ncbi:hypothetical protein F6B41_33305 [Microbacterium lushaniae]|nr:hypothetical protein F6B41_33305 [Microbacterium lushaniae]
MTAPGALPRDQEGQQPQRLLGALLADYSFDAGPGLTSASIIRILGEFGVTESGARSALSRATQRGLLEASRGSGATRYRLGEWGRSVHHDRLVRVLRFGEATEWDGSWTVGIVPASVGDRVERRRWRQRLEDAGFGSLADGVWIHPRSTVDDLRALAAAQGVALAAFRGPLELDGLSATDAFDLRSLRAAYARFLDEYGSFATAATSVDGGTALRVRTTVLRDWRRLSLTDPDLPAAVLPADWPQPHAREVFLTVRRLLARTALAHLRTLVEADVADHVRPVEPDAA